MPAALRGGGQNLRDHLIATAARLIDQRGTADLAVRDIARAAKVADGALYNHFDDREDLLAHALLVHVGRVMSSMPRLLPTPGEGTLAENLRLFIEGGVETLVRVTPAFAGLLSQPKVLLRFHAMAGGDAAFDPAAEMGSERAPADAGTGHSNPAEMADDGSERAMPAASENTDDAVGGRALPAMLISYLRGEQRLGRVDAAADVDAAAALIVGAIHGQILPRILFNPPGTPIAASPELAARLAETVLHGIAAPSAEKR